MKKIAKTILPVFILITIGFIIILFSPSGVWDENFYRVELENFQQDSKFFKVDKRTGRIYFQKGKHKFQLSEIPTPNGYYFYLNGKKQIKLRPKFISDIGFYTYLYFERLGKRGNIFFSIEVNSRDTNQRIYQITTQKAFHPVYINLKITGEDLVLLKFKGNGVIYFSKPIIYKKKVNSKRKNIIFIALDTLRGDQIGVHLGDQSLTPNINRFIEDSVYFKNAYAQTSWTLPSFMSLFTGLYEYNHEVGIKNSLSPKKPFLIREMSHKFITFGYHGGKVMNSRWGYWQGFDYYKKFRFAGALFPQAGQSLFRTALELLEKSTFPELFLFLHTYQVHSPYTPPTEFLYRINKQPEFMKIEAVNYNNPAKTYLPVEEELKKSMKELYQAEILAFDSYFGEFIKRLKAMNLYENSMIVFISDHGEEFFEHNGWAHSHSLYNELTKVPVIIKFPGNRFKNSKVNNVVGILDLMPTILNFYGIDYEADKLDGKNLMPLIKEGRIRSPAYVVTTISTGRYFEAIPPKIAIIFDDYKLIYNQPFNPRDLDFFKDYTLPPETPKLELYDLKKDPYEKHNIAYTHPGLRKKMMPVILKIERLIKKKLSSKRKKKSLDKEVEDQLKELGYL